MSINRWLDKVVIHIHNGVFSSVQSFSHVQLFATPWITELHASLSITNSRSLSKLMSIDRWMDKEAVVHTHSGVLLSHKNGHIWVSSNEVDEPRAYYTEWRKSEREREISYAAAAAAAKSLQSCPTLYDPIDGSPPGSSVPGILQARILEWVSISFSNAWKRKVKVKLLCCVLLLATPWTAAYQAPPSILTHIYRI